MVFVSFVTDEDLILRNALQINNLATWLLTIRHSESAVAMSLYQIMNMTYSELVCQVIQHLCRVFGSCGEAYYQTDFQKYLITTLPNHKTEVL